MNDSTLLRKCIKQINDFDSAYNYKDDKTLEKIIFYALSLCGEVGEAANVVKKISRDGDSAALRNHLAEEIVDVIIYTCKLIKVADIDFDTAWKNKFEELNRRWSKKNE